MKKLQESTLMLAVFSVITNKLYIINDHLGRFDDSLGNEDRKSTYYAILKLCSRQNNNYQGGVQYEYRNNYTI